VKIWFLSWGGLALLAALGLPGALGAAVAAAPKPVVVLDPGHGGSDRGVKMGSVVEADYVLDLAGKVAETLKKAGYDVRLTRDSDVDMTPASRTAVANNADAVALVSLHVNDSYNPQAHGLRVFIPAGGAVDEPSAPLWEQASRLQAAASRALGQRIAWALGESTAASGQAKAVQSLKLALFRGLTVPAAEIELDYASNPEALAALKDSATKDALAVKLARGIINFVQSGAGHAN
jgi:N-acetylmuramoyl-L-alanine amidase